MDLFKTRATPESDTALMGIPGYHVPNSPETPDRENLKFYRAVLAAGAGAITNAPHVFQLFGAPREFTADVEIRPYRARTPQTVEAPYYFPSMTGGRLG